VRGVGLFLRSQFGYASGNAGELAKRPDHDIRRARSPRRFSVNTREALQVESSYAFYSTPLIRRCRSARSSRQFLLFIATEADSVIRYLFHPTLNT
jgi:hypothetical protein